MKQIELKYSDCDKRTMDLLNNFEILLNSLNYGWNCEEATLQLQNEYDELRRKLIKKNFVFNISLTPSSINRKRKPDIKVKPIKTQNSDNDRFVYSKDESDGSAWVFDNHLRDGYGIYTEKGMFDEGHFSYIHFKYFIDKLNKYFNENQTLKSESEYHQLLLRKLDISMEKYFDLYLAHYDDEDDKLKNTYHYVYEELMCIADELQGDEYG